MAGLMLLIMLQSGQSYKRTSEIGVPDSFAMPLHSACFMAYLKAAEAGVDIVDCALSPFAWVHSQPSTIPHCHLRRQERDTA
jgi:pyruvate carboxylase